MTSSLKLLLLLLLTLSSTPRAEAVILYGTDDPAANTTAPSGSLANSGWQFEGQWGRFLGTPIAPHFFVTARHVGGSVGQIFYFQNVAYTTTAEFPDSSTDLCLWQVAETFPSYAPLYQGSDEVGRQLVVIGRGTQRGSAVKSRHTLRGWFWGMDDGMQRWGQNAVSEIVSGGTDNDLLYARFNRPSARRGTQASRTEAHLSSGDSGGGVFINADGFWRLAGISYAVDGPFYTAPSATSQFDAALFDARSFYHYDGTNYVLITGSTRVPTGFYSTRISSRMTWIRSLIGTP